MPDCLLLYWMPMKSTIQSDPDYRAGKIYARRGRNFVQASWGPSWPKYIVSGVVQSRWLNTLAEALAILAEIEPEDEPEDETGYWETVSGRAGYFSPAAASEERQSR